MAQTKKRQTKRRQTKHKKRGGATNRLPIDDKDKVSGKALQAAWDFLFVMGHGKTNDRVFVVPKDTYIFFIANSGESTLIEPGLEIDNFIYNTHETEENWFNNIASNARQSGILHNLTYNKAIASSANEPRKKRAFYEPGDIIQDIRIEFKNYGKPLLPTGVFVCPLPGSLKETMDKFYKDTKDPFTKDTDKRFFNISKNLLKTQLFVDGQLNDTLYNVIRNLPTNPGKKRLLLVGSCRGVSDPANNSRKLQEKLNVCRSLSANSRCRTCDGNHFLVNLATLQKFRNDYKHIPEYKPLVVKAGKIIGNLIDDINSNGEDREELVSDTGSLYQLLQDIKDKRLVLGV